MDKYYLGDLCFFWDSGDYELNNGQYFERFRTCQVETTDEIRFQGCFEPLEPYGKLKAQEMNYSYEIYQAAEESLIIYHWAKRRFAFAIWPDRIHCDNVNTCYFDPDMKNQVPMNADWFFGVSGLHRALLQKEAPILHASYIDYEGKAILFSAPSGTGKSTQAKLWQDFARAEIINGDRVLLRKRQDTWYAFGYPSCGSSKICINRTLPLQAIVILEQGFENKVVPLSYSEKIRCLVSGIEVYRWDIKEVEVAFHIAEMIASQVPVIKLICRPDENAVTVLRKELEGLKR